MIIEAKSDMGKKTQVFINGIQTKKAFYVDTEQGLVKAYKCDENGKIIVTNNKHEIIEHRGKMHIKTKTL